MSGQAGSGLRCSSRPSSPLSSPAGGRCVCSLPHSFDFVVSLRSACWLNCGCFIVLFILLKIWICFKLVWGCVLLFLCFDVILSSLSMVSLSLLYSTTCLSGSLLIDCVVYKWFLSLPFSLRSISCWLIICGWGVSVVLSAYACFYVLIFGVVVGVVVVLISGFALGVCIVNL